MLKMAKKILFLSVLTSTALGAMADRGTGKKSKNKVLLNIGTTGSSFRNLISLNSKSGLRYTGSMISSQSFTSKSINRNTLVTYQKGNTVYIIPYKQKIITPEIGKGYTGMKLIIKSH